MAREQLERIRGFAFPAKYWEPLAEQGGRVRVQCLLCPRECVISEGALGFCGVRGALDGKLRSFIYGRPSSIAVDPVEKKPLYHFHPGSLCLSLGTIGCNFHCEHCQNCGISIARADDAGVAMLSRKAVTPENLAKMCKEQGAGGIAFTYNEPGIWVEFILDVFSYFKEHTGFYTALVTNGFINAAPLEGLLALTGAYRVDLKSVVPQRLMRMAAWDKPEKVLESIALAVKRGAHVEVVTNVVTGWNDSEEELTEMARLLADIAPPDTPWHFTRYFPRHHYAQPPTAMAKLDEAAAIARAQGFQFVYLGNVEGGCDTTCPSCGNVLIRRSGYEAQALIKEPRCPKCGSAVKSLVL